MMAVTPKKGDLVKIPQDTVIYKINQQDNQLLYVSNTKKPILAIYLGQYNENYSKIFLEETAGCVNVECLHELGASDAY